MLTIIVPIADFFDEATNEFIVDETIIQLEHSLVSLSKWESKWEKPFLSPDEKSQEEAISYIEAMTLTPNVPPETYQKLTAKNYSEINDYINAKMTATWFNDKPSKSHRREIITSEIIYYWMNSLNIEKEFEEWNLSRLFTYIRVVNEKNQPAKKQSPTNQAEMMARRAELNAKRQAELNTSG
jgi:hypothetical protein